MHHLWSHYLKNQLWLHIWLYHLWLLIWLNHLFVYLITSLLIAYHIIYKPMMTTRWNINITYYRGFHSQTGYGTMKMYTNCKILKIHFLFGLELKLIPAQTGNGTIKMYTKCKIDLSVYDWPPKRKDMQLLNNKELYVLPLWRSAFNWQTNFTICEHFQSYISCLGWNKNQFQAKQEM